VVAVGCGEERLERGEPTGLHSGLSAPSVRNERRILNALLPAHALPHLPGIGHGRDGFRRDERNSFYLRNTGGRERVDQASAGLHRQRLLRLQSVPRPDLPDGDLSRKRQRPCHLGSRFSLKAATPSWRSPDATFRRQARSSSSTASASGIPNPRSMAALASRRATGDDLQSSSASSRVADSRASRSTSRVTRPISNASCPLIWRPVKIRSLARPSPTLRASS